MRQRIANYLAESNPTPLLVILGISVVARLLSAFMLGNSVEILPGTYDQISYHNLAIRVIEGHGFTFGQRWWPITAADAPTAHWSFLYTGYLIAVYKLFGMQPLVARLIQALIVGLLHPYLAYRLGRLVYSHLVGLITAAWTAVYIYFIYYAGTLMTEPFYITAILLALFLALRLTQTESDNPWLLAAALGVALAATILLRQLFLLFVPFLLLWVWWASGRRYIKQLVVVLAIIAAAIAPFTLYNYGRFGRLVLLNTNSGYAFFWGNHPIYGTHFQPILQTATYEELIPEELRDLDEAALENALMQRGIQFVVEEPGRYLLLSLSRIPPYFMFWPSAGSGLISNVSRVLSFGLSLPFMLWGLWLGGRQWRWNLSAPVALLWLFVLFYTSIHVLTWTLIRYRLPVDAVLLLFASLPIAQLLELKHKTVNAQIELTVSPNK